MHYIAELMRRKTLVAAVTAVAIGIALMIRAFVLPQGTPAPQPDTADLASLEEPAALGEPSAAEPQPSAEPALLVYVTGAVAAPDVYRLPAEARVKDLVLAAGGLNADADLEQINLASRVTDGQHVYVARIGEAPATVPAPAAGGGTGSLLDLNSATADQLDALPGIGPAIAERIVAYRAENGPFAAVEDLQDIKGIGSALFEQVAPLVTAGP